MLRRSLIPGLVLLVLAFGASDAYADPFKIVSYEPSNPVAGQNVTFTADRENGNDNGSDLVWDFGDGSPTGRGKTVTHAYENAGTYTVTLSEPNSDGTGLEVQDEATITVGPASDPPPPANASPSATFSFAPASPLAGDEVTFTGGSDPDGDSVTRFWEFGDGTTDTRPAPTHMYLNAGNYTATLTVTDARGASATTFQTVTVSAPTGSPPADATPTTGPVGGSTLLEDPLIPTVPMRPFPVVRIAGVLLRDGALVRILSVRGPRGMQVRVRCHGRSCPVGSIARTSVRRLIRLHRFERRLSAGTTLELSIRKAGRIGKYTRFLIRAGKSPARVDRCLLPGRARPVRC